VAEDLVSHLPQTPHDEHLLRYLEAIRDVRKEFAPEGMLYSGLEDFLLQHGSFFRRRALLDGVQPMMLKQCFENAYRLAVRTPAVHYVEGMALIHGLPVHHGWCIDREGNTVDPTWTGEMLGLSYFGVELNLAEVKQSRRVGCLALTDDWRREHPHLHGDPNVFAPDMWFRR
jgi:hypothetical protein